MDSAKAIRKALRIARADGGPVDPPPDRQLNSQGLYSAAAEAARALPQAKGQPQQMLNSLKGVKPDELKWAGVNSFKSLPSINKESLARHFENSLPDIREEDGGGKFQRYSMTPNTYGGRGNLKGGYGTNYREKLLTLPDRNVDIPRFSEHPDNQKLIQQRMEALDEAHRIWDSLPEGNRNENPAYREAADRANMAQRNEAEARATYRNNTQKVRQERQNFQSSHWDSPNVLAHLRMSDWQAPGPGPRLPPPPKADRTAALTVNGEEQRRIVPAWSTPTPGLVVHKELKGKPGEYSVTHEPSGLTVKRAIPYHHARDLANRLGNIGFDWTMPDPEDLKAHFKQNTELEKRRRVEFDREPLPGPKPIPARAKPAEKNLLLDELQSDWGQKARNEGVGQRNLTPPNSVGVPDAPYIGKTEGWTDLGLKRALREAAQGGYHRLLWTPGEKAGEAIQFEHTGRFIAVSQRL